MRRYASARTGRGFNVHERSCRGGWLPVGGRSAPMSWLGWSWLASVQARRRGRPPDCGHGGGRIPPLHFSSRLSPANRPAIRQPRNDRRPAMADCRHPSGVRPALKLAEFGVIRPSAAARLQTQKSRSMKNDLDRWRWCGRDVSDGGIPHGFHTTSRITSHNHASRTNSSNAPMPMKSTIAARTTIDGAVLRKVRLVQVDGAITGSSNFQNAA